MLWKKISKLKISWSSMEMEMETERPLEEMIVEKLQEKAGAKPIK